MKNKIVIEKSTALCGSVLAILTAVCPNAQAKIQLIQKDPTSSSILAPLSVDVQGSIRPEFYWESGRSEHDYRVDGHDGGSRLYVNLDYDLNKDTSLVGYFEWGFDIGRLFKLKDHYDPEAKPTVERQLFAGLTNKKYGTLLYGRHKSIYWLAVGNRMDMWINDALSSPASNGIDTNQQGTNRPARTLYYSNTFGPVTVYGQYLFAENETDTGRGNEIKYRRKYGAGVGLNWDITKELSWGAVFNHTKGYLKSPMEGRRNYNQNTLATSVDWQPGNWYLAAGASYYTNQAPIQKETHYTVDNFFAKRAHGYEMFVGYTFKHPLSFIEGIQPYVAADHTRFKGGDNYRRNNIYTGVGVTFNRHLQVYLERTLSHSSKKEPDSTWLNFFVNF